MIFDNRTLEIINLLLTHKKPVRIEQIMTELAISKRSAYYIINKTNEMLAYKKIDKINFRKNEGYFFTDEQKNSIESTMGVLEDIDRILSQEQRLYYIICICMYPVQPVSIKSISDYCQTSRNTAINDLKLAAEELIKYNLTLQYMQRKGYVICGATFQKRAVLFMYIRKLLGNYSYHNIDVWDGAKIHLYHNRLREIEKSLNTKYEKGTLTVISVFLNIIRSSNERHNFDILELSNISKTDELILVDKYFEEFSVHERIYLAIHLLGYRCGFNLIDVNDESKNIQTYEWAQRIVDNFERIAGISFENRNDLVDSIYFHLKMTIYLYKFSVQIVNPFIKDIKNNYRAIYEITERSCDGLEKYFEFPIPESEFCFLTAHFASFLCKGTVANSEINVLIVCLNGRATSNLLKSEIENLYPNVNIAGVISSAEIENFNKPYDCIISTLNLDAKWKYIKVNAVLTKEDKVNIMSYFMLNFNENTQAGRIKQILDIVKRFVNKSDFLFIKHEVYKVINNINYVQQQDVNLLSFLTPEKIIINRQSLGWEESILRTAMPLVKAGSIEKEHAQSIIKVINAYGHYMVITPGVALIHGRPENGVNRLDVSMLLSKTPIEFGEHNAVHVIFFIAIKDKNTHLGILHNIMQIVREPERIAALASSTSSAQVMNMLYTI